MRDYLITVTRITVEVIALIWLAPYVFGDKK